MTLTRKARLKQFLADWNIISEPLQFLWKKVQKTPRLGTLWEGKPWLCHKTQKREKREAAEVLGTIKAPRLKVFVRSGEHAETKDVDRGDEKLWKG